MRPKGYITALLSFVLFAFMPDAGRAQAASSDVEYRSRYDSHSFQPYQLSPTDRIELCTYDSGTIACIDKPSLKRRHRSIQSASHSSQRLFCARPQHNNSVLGRLFNPDRERVLPFLGSQAREMGYDIPLPFGVGGNIAYMDQPMDIEQISLSVAGGPATPLSEIPPFRVQSRDTNYSMRFDVWLLPFINVYGIVGHTRGRAAGDVLVTGVSGLPPVAVVPISIDYDGPTYGGGCTGAIGYKNLFAVVDWNYASTNLEGVDTGIAARTVAPRVGLNFETTSFWVGGFFLSVDKELSSTVDVGGVPVVLLIDLDVATDWNFIYGLRWIPSPNIELVVEHGFSRRNQIVGAAALRF